MYSEALYSSFYKILVKQIMTRIVLHNFEYKLVIIFQLIEIRMKDCLLGWKIEDHLL